MSIIDFTHNTCKNIDIMNKQLVENFEEHFAMYSLIKIKNISNIEVSNDNDSYIIKGTEEECKDIVEKLSRLKCSNFNDTLSPIITMISGGLQIEFKIDGE